MREKRKSMRVLVHITLSICDLYKQADSGIHNLDSPIEVTDISEHGIGFLSECILPLHYYFCADVSIDGHHVIHTILQIIRCSVLDLNTYSYGCRFESLNQEALEIIKSYTQKNGES